MKRILGFLIGVGLSVGASYGLRRWLAASDSTKPAVGLADRSSITTAPPPTGSDTTLTPAEDAPKQTTRYTVRRTGPRPQVGGSSNGSGPASIVGESEGRHTEPGAASETDQAATSSRSETAEPALLENVAVEAPAGTNDIEGAGGADDFTVIEDIGAVFNKKLQEAGITTFADLAALSAEEIEQKTGIPASRIERNKWLEQASELDKKK